MQDQSREYHSDQGHYTSDCKLLESVIELAAHLNPAQKPGRYTLILDKYNFRSNLRSKEHAFLKAIILKY